MTSVADAARLLGDERDRRLHTGNEGRRDFRIVARVAAKDVTAGFAAQQRRQPQCCFESARTRTSSQVAGSRSRRH